MARRESAPCVVVLSDPADAGPTSRWWRSAADSDGGFDLVCSSKLIQRRLVEAGVVIDAVAVVRPGVDFGAIRRCRPEVVRAELDLSPDDRVLMMPSPPSRVGGHYYGLWAAALLHYVWHEIRLVVPGISREQQRVYRFARRSHRTAFCRFPRNRFSPAELVAASDALIVPALGDVATDWLAWAMAGSKAIIGSAVPAVAELVADRHNGFLCKPGEPIRWRPACTGRSTRRRR